MQLGVSQTFPRLLFFRLKFDSAFRVEKIKQKASIFQKRERGRERDQEQNRKKEQKT